MTDPDRYDRLPGAGGDGVDGDEPSRASVLTYFEERFDIDPATFEDHTFWEKGAGSVWAVAGDAPNPIEVEALGLRLLRTGGRHWKPTTDGVQRFGADADRNVLELPRGRAARFVAGEDQDLDWDGDWGYLVVATDLGGVPAPLGVGLYLDGTLRSQIPKARRVALD